MRSLAYALSALALAGCVEEPPPREPSVLPFSLPVDVVFVSEMSGAFVLEGVTMRVDGSPLVKNGLTDVTEVALGGFTLRGGTHEVEVEADYRGHGYGVFAYLDKYHFKARTRRNFELPDPRPRVLRCIGYERGGVTTPIEERPQIRCEVALR
ncbi:MAG: hypothetical protein ACXVEE_39485 [Polyangiales bacterium]